MKHALVPVLGLLALGCNPSPSPQPVAPAPEPTAGSEPIAATEPVPVDESPSPAPSPRPIPIRCYDADCAGVVSQMTLGTGRAVAHDPPPVLPASSDLPSEPSPAPLQEARGFFDRLAGAGHDDVADQTMARTLSRLAQGLGAIGGRAAQMERRCAAVVARRPRFAPACATLRADARDVYARFVASYRIRPTHDYEAEVRQRPAAEHDAHLAAFRAHFLRIVEAEASRLYCEAAAMYREADTPRAREQLARYGETFLAQCDARTTEP